MVLIVCPEVKTAEMAKIIAETATDYAKLINRFADELKTKEEKNAFISGWEHAEMLNPILKTKFSQLFRLSNVCTVLEFDSENKIISIVPIKKELLP